MCLLPFNAGSATQFAANGLGRGDGDYYIPVYTKAYLLYQYFHADYHIFSLRDIVSSDITDLETYMREKCVPSL